MGSSLSIEEYAKRYREIASQNNLEVTDEEIAKMFASHIVVAEWQRKEEKRISARKNKWRIDEFRKGDSNG